MLVNSFSSTFPCLSRSKKQNMACTSDLVTERPDCTTNALSPFSQIFPSINTLRVKSWMDNVSASPSFPDAKYSLKRLYFDAASLPHQIERMPVRIRIMPMLIRKKFTLPKAKIQINIMKYPRPQCVVMNLVHFSTPDLGVSKKTTKVNAVGMTIKRRQKPKKMK